ncbi:MAG: hypothetical protein NTU81_01050 [Candidatus Nomurabacteria bacterium]|nr:hypothetical protein [Candidatus Nomurabacteria bacterium]
MDYLFDLINGVSESFDSKTSKMSNKTNSEKIAIRDMFVSSLIEIEEAIVNFPGIDERKITIIEDSIKEATLRRELQYECNITEFESPAQCGFVKRGEHFQYPFLVLNSNAPDEYSGSADEDIESSYFESLTNLINGNIYLPHKVFLSNAINLFFQISERTDNMAEVVLLQAKDFLKPAN